MKVPVVPTFRSASQPLCGVPVLAAVVSGVRVSQPAVMVGQIFEGLQEHCGDVARRVVDGRMSPLLLANSAASPLPGTVLLGGSPLHAGLSQGGRSMPEGLGQYAEVDRSDEDACHEARRLSLLREVHQQRQEEQERERHRTLQLKSTLAEAVNASRERFNAAHAARRSNSERLRSDQQRVSDHDLPVMRENGHAERSARLCGHRLAAAAVVPTSSSATGSRSKPPNPSAAAAHPPIRGVEDPGVAVDGSQARVAPLTWAAGGVAAGGAAVVSPSSRPGPCLQRDRVGARSAGVGGLSAGRLETSLANDRSVSPMRNTSGPVRTGPAERSVGSVERRTGRSVSPSSTRPGARSSLLQDTASSAQKRAMSSQAQGKRRAQSAGPRYSERSGREVPSASPSSSSLKSRPQPATTPRGLAASRSGGVRSGGGGSSGALHAAVVPAAPSLQAQPIVRQFSAGNSSSSTAVCAKTPRLPATGAKSTDGSRPSTPLGGRPHRAGDTSSASAQNLSAARLSANVPRSSGQDPNSPKIGKRTGPAPLSARAVANQAPNAQRKRQGHGGVESSPVASSGTSSPGAGSPPTIAAGVASTTSTQTIGLQISGNGHTVASPSTSTPVVPALPSGRAAKASVLSGPTVRPPSSLDVGPAATHTVEAESRGGAVPSELNELDSLQHAGDLPEMLIMQTPQSAPAAESVHRSDPLAPRPTTREQRRPEFGNAGVASVRLPADGERLAQTGITTTCENGHSGFADSVEEEERAILELPTDGQGETNCQQEVEVDVRLIDPPLGQDVASEELLLGAPAEQCMALPHDAMIVAMTSGPGQEPPASFLNSLSPLSPIREVAEGGSTPKAIDARELLEIHSMHAHRCDPRVNSAARSLTARGQLDDDLPDETSDAQDDDIDASDGDPLTQLPSSKERYLQIRDRFLAK